jgi:hypothetical protein
MDSKPLSGFSLSTRVVEGNVEYTPMTWGAPGVMDTCSSGCSMKPEVSIGYREEAAAVLYA